MSHNPPKADEAIYIQSDLPAAGTVIRQLADMVNNLPQADGERKTKNIHMKNLIYFVLMAVSITASSVVQAQTKTGMGNVKITSLKVDAERTNALKAIKNNIFTIDAQNNIVPQKGYTIRLDKKTKKIFITQFEGGIKFETQDGSVDINGMIFRCYSNEECAACMPAYSAGTFYCKTSGCRCYDELILDPRNIASFQTADGQSHNGSPLRL